jgi:nucleoid-associated protein EbfC
MNIMKMMKQAQEMQSKMQSTQAELAAKTVEGTAGGGAVTVTATGAGDVIAIKINPSAVDPDDVEMLEDLVLTGVKNALQIAKEMSAQEMGKLTAGLNLPPGMGF